MISRASSDSPYEASIGFSRAVRAGKRILVSGTAPLESDGSSTPGDAEAQAERCFAIIVAAIERLGGCAEDVVRTRMYLIDPADADAVGRAHARWFDDVRPAATMVVVSALLRPELRVEIEAEAVVTGARSRYADDEELPMKVKIERWGDDLVVPTPDELVERFQIKEGQEIDSSYFEQELEERQGRKAED